MRRKTSVQGSRSIPPIVVRSDDDRSTDLMDAASLLRRTAEVIRSGRRAEIQIDPTDRGSLMGMMSGRSESGRFDLTSTSDFDIMLEAGGLLEPRRIIVNESPSVRRTDNAGIASSVLRLATMIERSVSQSGTRLSKAIRSMRESVELLGVVRTVYGDRPGKRTVRFGSRTTEFSCGFRRPDMEKCEEALQAISRIGEASPDLVSMTVRLDDGAVPNLHIRFAPYVVEVPRADAMDAIRNMATIEAMSRNGIPVGVSSKNPSGA